MKLLNVKTVFATKLKVAGGLNMPDDVTLSDLFHEALIYVATHCLPRELLRDVEIDTDEEVLRLISRGRFVIIPEKPVFDANSAGYHAEAELQIDHDLDYAVINKAVALYSREKGSILKHENEAQKVINRYKSNFNKVGE